MNGSSVIWELQFSAIKFINLITSVYLLPYVPYISLMPTGDSWPPRLQDKLGNWAFGKVNGLPWLSETVIHCFSVSSQGFVTKVVCLALSVVVTKRELVAEDLYPYSILTACSNHSHYSTNPGIVPPAVKKKIHGFDFLLRKINFSAHLPSISSLLIDDKTVS